MTFLCTEVQKGESRKNALRNETGTNELLHLYLNNPLSMGTEKTRRTLMETDWGKRKKCFVCEHNFMNNFIYDVFGFVFRKSVQDSDGRA